MQKSRISSSGAEKRLCQDLTEDHWERKTAIRLREILAPHKIQGNEIEALEIAIRAKLIPRISGKVGGGRKSSTETATGTLLAILKARGPKPPSIQRTGAIINGAGAKFTHRKFLDNCGTDRIASAYARTLKKIGDDPAKLRKLLVPNDQAWKVLKSAETIRKQRKTRNPEWLAKEYGCTRGQFRQILSRYKI